LLGHSKLESTVRYLGIEIDDALEISEQTEIRARRAGPGGTPGLADVEGSHVVRRRHRVHGEEPALDAGATNSRFRLNCDSRPGSASDGCR
jgi:hypothetical protein